MGGRLARLVVVAGCLLGGCIGSQAGLRTPPPAHQDAVYSSAQRDLQCSLVTVIRLGETEYGADGCGHQATYRVVCDRRASAEQPCVAALDAHIR